MLSLRGRQRAIDTVAAAIDAAAAGRGRVVVLEGGAGTGKTRLLETAREQAITAGLTGTHVVGAKAEGDFAFGVLSQLLRPLLAELEPADRSALTARSATIAAPPFVDGDPARSWPPAPENDSPAPPLLQALQSVLVALSADRPLLLTVDDLDRADEPTLRFLAFLAHRIQPLPIALIVTVRPPVEHELLAGLIDDHDHIRLGPLPAAAATEVVRDVLGPSAPDATIAACVEQAAGNPFLLRALASAGTDSSATREDDDPETSAIERFVARQLADVGPQATALAEAIAVLDGAGRMPAAAAVAELDPDETIDAWEVLRKAGVVAPDRTPRFAQPIVRTALLGAIPAPRRALRHARAAWFLSASAAPPDVLAPHLLESPFALDDNGVVVLRVAAEHALGNGRPADALLLLQRADGEAMEVADRAELRRRLAVAAVRAQGVAALDRFDAARISAIDARGRAAVALDHAAALHDLGRLDDALTVLNDAAAAIDGGLDGSDGDLALRIEAQRASLAISPAHLPQLQPRLAELASVSAPLTPARRELLCAAGFAELVGGHGLQAARTVALAFDGLDHAHELAARSLELGVLTAIGCGRIELVERFVDQEISDAYGRNDARRRSAALILRTLMAISRGDLRSAEDDARTALAALPPSDPLRRVSAVSLLALTLTARGEQVEAEQTLATLDRPVGVDGSATLDQLDAVTAFIRLKQGRSAEAATMLEALLPRATPACAVPVGPFLALALRASGWPDEALARAQEEVRQAREDHASPAAVGFALRVLGVVEGGERGIKTLEDAIVVLRRSTSQLELGRALIDLGAALRLNRRRADARPVLREGLEIALAGGAARLAQRARDELAATGRRVRRGEELQRDSLTPSEHRIARFAVQGRSNGEIAGTLFVSKKTVEMHLSSVYRKLGVRMRTDLTEALIAPATPVVEEESHTVDIQPLV